jgi:hypothetical protein
MRTRSVFFTILFALICSSFRAQKLSQGDSIKLVSTWNKTVEFLRTKDTVNLGAICLDSIDCKLCGFRDDTITDTNKPLTLFFKSGLDKLNSNQKLWKIINSKSPKIILSGYIDKNGNGECIYSIAYLFWKPNELGKKHEGGQVLFDYVLRKSDFKLFSISTLP